MPEMPPKTQKLQNAARQHADGCSSTRINCVENKASLFSRLFFTWVTPLVVHGWNTPVQPESLPEIGIGNELEPSAIAANFQSEWAKEVHRASTANTNRLIYIVNLLTRPIQRLWRRLLKRPLDTSRASTRMPNLIFPLYQLVSWHLARAFIARLVTELIPVAIPVLVKLTTTFAQHKRQAVKLTIETSNNGSVHTSIPSPPGWQGYVLVVTMFALLLLYSWSFQWFFYDVGKATVITRTALVSAIYRKSLVLSAQARSRLTLGKLTNLISSDISQVERGVTNVIVCITIPIQVIASIVVLIYMIGPTGIIGWCLVLAFVPMQMWVSRYLVKLRGKAIKYTDKRIRTTRETLQGIKVVKAYAWESSILETMQRIRDKEVGIIARLNLVRYSLISVALHSPVFASILTFAALVLTGGKLKNSAVFATIGIFNSMSVPLSWFPGALTETINTLVPLRRIAEALLEEELVCASDPCLDLDVAVRISDGVFKWNDGAAIEVSNQKGNDRSDALKVSQEVFQLKAVNLEIPHGSLVIVIGSVGSGKSSLASAIVGEMDCTSGSIIYGGTLGYAPQVPWMTNATIRENIVFGKPFDYETYLSVIEACELEADLAAFPAGDQTEIGERGVTLSGGQKQRISIARTAYAECNISVLDDCLSAVDVRTSRAIFKQCIRGFLASTTRILVTNSLDYLPTADLVITMDNGQVVESGTFLDLMEMGGVTAAIYASFMSHENSEYFEVGKLYTTDSSLYTATPIRETARSSKSSGRSAQLHVSNIDGEKQSALTFASLAARTEISELPDMEATSSGSSQKSTNRMSDLNVADDKELSTNTVPIESSNTHARKLMSQEERETGQISWSIYRTYIQAGGGNIVLAGILLCLAISQGCRVGSDFWMRLWIHHRRDSSETKLFVGLYALLGGLQFLWFGLFSALLVLSVYKSSKKLHAQAFERVLRSPMSFFDTTPLGRILNRFTRDIDSLDLALCDFFRQFYQNIGRSASAFVTISILVPVFLVALVPLLVASWGLIYVYLRTSVEIQRVAAISRSPLYAHYTETLQGLSTIRAYRAQERYIAQADFMLDNANRPHWYSLAVQSWIWLRVDYLSHLLTLVICLIIVAQPTRWDAAAVGLMLVQATQMGAYATYAGRGWSELQNNMNSVERVSYYATMLDKEDTLETNATQCAVSSTAITMRPITAMWPERGTVIVRNLSMRYRPELPLALQGVDMEIYSGEKIGIVGRSGAGKSSLVTALFRLVEPASGKIFIDGIDTQCVPLDRLRKAIGILPQDSVLFEGSVRSNLDLFHEYSDTAAWDILRQVCMYDLVSQHPQKLDMMVGEGGENFSAGQRQLLCLARALLRKPKILVLDEATANVDHETDAAIQRAISLTGQDMTVISIAHRLQTVVTYDKIFVVDDGRIVESGTPLSLLEQYTYSASSFENTITASQSPFYGMIREMNSAAVESLLAQASKKSK